MTNDAWNDQYLRNPASVKTLDEVIGKAADIGLGIWLYDEYGFPSGAANGLTMEQHPEYEAARHHFVQAERQRCWCGFLGASRGERADRVCVFSDERRKNPSGRKFPADSFRRKALGANGRYASSA